MTTELNQKIDRNVELREKISYMVDALASVCDGAVKKDGSGFSAADQWIKYADLSHNLMLRRVQRDLIKYKQQLSYFGFDPLAFDKTMEMKVHDCEIEIPIEGDNKKGLLTIKAYQDAKRVLRISISTGKAFSQKFVTEIRMLKSREWDIDKKLNTIVWEEVGDALEIIKDAYNVEINKNDIPIPFLLLPFDAHQTVNIIEPPIPKFTGCIFIDRNRLIIQTSYNAEMIDFIKTNFTGRKYSKDEFEKPSWIIPLRDNTDKIEEIKFICNNPYGLILEVDINSIISTIEYLIELEHDKKELAKLSSATSDDSIKINVPDNGMKPYPYQIVGVEFLNKLNGRGMIADEMGLGKTIQALLYAYNHPEIKPVVIVVPAPVKINWLREIKNWCPTHSCHIIEGINKHKDGILPDVDMYIINYDILSGWIENLMNKKAQMIICDESHMVKNSRSIRSQAVGRIVEVAKSVILLTGTPVLNKPSELIYPLILLDAKGDKRLENKKTFLMRYCNPQPSEYAQSGYTYNGASNEEELQQVLRENVMIRRMKKDVLLELPPLRRIHVPVALKNENRYKHAEESFSKWAKKSGRKNKGEALVRIEKLRQLANDEKMDFTIDYIINALEQIDNALVFVHHRNYAESLATEFDKKGISYVKIVGGMTTNDRQNSIDSFNEKKVRVAICSIKASGVGLNLQKGANVAFFCEQSWTPADILQAEARIHRNGQTKTCDMYYLHAANTIEDYIAKILLEKQEICNAVLDTTSDEYKKAISEEDTMESVIDKLLNSYT